MKYGLSDNCYNQIKEIIQKYEKYKFVLFGSRARGNYKKTSDIDIAIFENVSNKDEYAIRNEFDILEIIYKIDLVFIDEKVKKELLNSILEEGVDF